MGGPTWDRLFPTAYREHTWIRDFLADPPREVKRFQAGIRRIEKHAKWEDESCFPSLNQTLPATPEGASVRAAMIHASEEHIPLWSALSDLLETPGVTSLTAPPIPPTLIADLRHHFQEEEANLYGPATALGGMEPALRETLEKIRKGATSNLSGSQVEAALTLVGVQIEPILYLAPISETYRVKLAVLPRESRQSVEEWADTVSIVEDPANPPEPLQPYRIYATALNRAERPSTWGEGFTVVEASVPEGATYCIPALRYWIPGRKDPALTLPHFTADPTDLNRGRPKVAGSSDLASYARIPTVKIPDGGPEGRFLHVVPPELIERVSDALGLPTPEEERAQKGRKKREDMISRGFGTCGVCFTAIGKSGRGLIVQHGYTMGGGGWGRGHFGMYKTSSECFGSWWLPWEVSSAATEAYVERLRNMLPGLVEAAHQWRTEGPTIPSEIQAIRHYNRIRPINRREGENPDKPETLPRGALLLTLLRPEPDWRAYCRDRAAEGEAAVVDLQREIEAYERAIRGWPKYPGATSSDPEPG